jgi:hypothetical protein
MREKMWIEYERKNYSKKCKTTKEIGKRYDTALPLEERIEICDEVLDDDFEILIRGKTQLIIYHHPTQEIFTDEGDNLIEVLINNIS